MIKHNFKNYITLKKPALRGLFCFQNLTFSFSLILFSSIVTASSVEYSNFKNDSVMVDGIEFRFMSYDYIVHLNSRDKNYGKTVFVGFKTQEISELNDYVIVKFLKGCHYESDGFSKWISRVRGNFGDIIPYKYQSLSIDSEDLDPSFNSSDLGRHYLYRWNDEGEFSNDSFYYGEKEPKNSFLFLRHSPGTAFENGVTSQNISMKYKSCLFKASEVPYGRLQASELLPNALYCFDWNYSREYDKKSHSFINHERLNPFCLE
ncbi:MAG: hypothetical protein VX341_12105 [Bdellovibrionota bacterium]|nr:hypothetical protein [Bdellovibrionota bacterium]